MASKHAMVARRRHLSDLSAQLRRFERRRHRRPARDRRSSSTMSRSLGVDGDLAVALLHLADARLRLRRRRLLRRRSGVRNARRFRRGGRARARARPQGHHRPGLFAQLRPACLVPGKPVGPRPIQRPTGMSGPTPSRTARRPTIGSRCSAARRGPGTRGAANIICTISCASSRDLNLHNPVVQDALLDVAQFWLDRGVDGFRIDAINFAMHDPQLRDNPPAPNGRQAHAAVRFPAASLQPVASRTS